MNNLLFGSCSFKVVEFGGCIVLNVKDILAQLLPSQKVDFNTDCIYVPAYPVVNIDANKAGNNLSWFVKTLSTVIKNLPLNESEYRMVMNFIENIEAHITFFINGGKIQDCGGLQHRPLYQPDYNYSNKTDGRNKRKRHKFADSIAKTFRPPPTPFNQHVYTSCGRHIPMDD